MFFKKDNCIKEIRNYRTYGVRSVQQGVGLTHSCIMIANYMASVRHKKTAVVELHEDGCLRQLLCAVDGVRCEQGSKSSVMNVDYYPYDVKVNVSKILNMPYEVVIMKFGSMTSDNEEEFMRCDYKIVIGSMSEWRARIFVDIAKMYMEKDIKNLIFCSAFGSDEDYRYYKSREGIDIVRIPFEYDPFAISRENIEILRMMTGG